VPGTDEPSVLSLIVSSLDNLSEKVDKGLSKIDAKLDGKADKSDLAEIRGELRGHSQRLGALEEAERLRKAKAEVHAERDQRSWWARTNKLKFLAGLIGGVSGLAIAVTSVVQTFHL
jgi:hypothetical protein